VDEQIQFSEPASEHVKGMQMYCSFTKNNNCKHSQQS